MKKLNAFFLCGTIVLASGPLMAQDYGHDQHNGDQNGGDQHDNRDHGNHGNHGDHGDRRDNDHGDHGDRDYGNRGDDHRGQGMYDRGRHEGWYRRGGRIPSDYRGGNYVVSDWRGNRLREPPRGYSWVRSDNGDFLLIALSTGIIASILSH